MSNYYIVLMLLVFLNSNVEEQIYMQKIFINYFYWILIRSAENYYGDALKENELPYTPYF